MNTSETMPDADVTPAVSPLERLQAVIVMAGSVRPTQIGSSVRSMLELPVEDDRTLLTFWQEQINEMAVTLKRSSLSVRVMFDRSAELPVLPEVHGPASFTAEYDPHDYRGTGGVLHDVTRHYDARDYVLVANGAQVLLRPLGEIAVDLADLNADVAVVSHRDGTPSGLMLVRCGVLDLIPQVGFMDMKEQALPRIAQEYSVRVTHYSEPTGVPMRTLSDYVLALSRHHLRLQGTDKPDPFYDNVRSTFSVIQDGAEVHPSARLHDSVVMAGARVHPGAILVRSLVCPGGVVRRDQRVIDRVLGGTGVAAGGRRA